MIKEVLEKNEWDEKYSQAETASGKFLQSWEWGEFQRTLGRKIFRFADDGTIALVVELPMPFGKKYWFCPKGPIGPIQDSGIKIQEFVKELKNTAKEAGAVYLRIEPSFEVKIAGAMRFHDVSPRVTGIIDLTKSEDEIFAAMHQKTRYNVRVAAHHGVKIERYHHADAIAGELKELFLETANRDKFNLHPFEYYIKQMAAFGEKGERTADVRPPHIVVFVARAEGKMLAAAIVMFDRDDATYLHGASSNELRNFMAPYALHAAIIRRAKERGYKHYDLWGISDDPRSGWAGITRFKRGWGGSEMSAPGTIDLPVNGFWYSVYRLVRGTLAKKK